MTVKRIKVVELEPTNTNVLHRTLVGKYIVSTVLLSDTVKMMDSYIAPLGEVQLGTPGDYETMVFAGNKDGVTDWLEQDFARYDTKEDALKGHSKIVEKWIEKQKWQRQMNILQ